MNKKTIAFALSFIIGIIILASLLYFGDFGKLIIIISEMNFFWLGFALAFYSINCIIRGLRFQKIVKELKYSLTFIEALSITFAGNLVNILIPAKIGDLLKPAIMKSRNQIPFSIGVGTIVTDRLLDFLSVFFLTLVSLFFLLPLPLLPEWVNTLILAGLVVVVGAIIGVIILLKTNYLQKFISMFQHISFLSKHQASLLNMLNQSKNILRPKTFLILFISSVVLWLLETVITYIIFISLGNTNVNIALIVFAIMIANLTKTLPLTPDGIGVYQAAIAAVFLAGGIPLEIGLAVGILDHALKIIYTIALGILGSIYLGLTVQQLSGLGKNDQNTVSGE